MKRTKEVRGQLLSFALTVMTVCMMFVCFSITSLAAEGKITTSSAKIRKEASTSSDTVGGAIYGDTFEIVNEVTGTDGMVWYQISFETDKLGYVRSDLMEKTGNTTTAATTTTDVQPVSASVVGDQVRVRDQASTGGSIVTTVRQGVVMTINGQATDGDGYTWYRVTFTSDSGDVTGYVRSDFVTVSGEIVPVTVTTDTPVVDTPVVDTPVVEDPVVTNPVVTKTYETLQDGETWYLIDNEAGVKYNIGSMIDASVKNPEVYAEMEDKVSSQKKWIVVLVILVVLLGVAVTLLILKIKDVTDEAYFTAIEKETIRQRQNQKQGTKGSNVMHTVGADSKSGTTVKQSAPVKTSVPKMNVEKTNGSKPQTVKVSNPADTRAEKPVQQKTVQRPVEKAVKSEEVKKTIVPSMKEEAQKPVDNTKQTWQSKNFMTDDEDDEFEYGFLDWDEGEE